MITIIELLHYYTLLLVEFLLFFTVPSSVETVMPIRTFVIVCLMVTFIVDTFEQMRTRLIFFHSKSIRINILVFFETLQLLSVMFYFVRSVAFDASRHIRSTVECQVALFPTIFTLRNTRISIHTVNSSNIISNVELLVYNFLSIGSTL